MALKRLIKAECIFILVKKRKSAPSRACANSLFFVGRCFDNFEVILMWIYHGIVLITDLVCSSKYKRVNLLDWRKKMVSFEHQLKMSEPFLKQNWKVYEKESWREKRGFRLLKGKKINISLPRKSGASCPRRYLLWWH